jgi:hypothetical protein
MFAAHQLPGREQAPGRHAENSKTRLPQIRQAGAPMVQKMTYVAPTTSAVEHRGTECFSVLGSELHKKFHSRPAGSQRSGSLQTCASGSLARGDEVRFTLTAEANLNDDLAFPFVNLGLELALAFKLANPGFFASASRGG